jgi:prepilin-type N-terminal cleavage/methylation domain-containing protein
MTRARISSEDGFTLVEVMVAIVVLLVGVLGTVTMIDGANAQTGRTKAREGATALARTVLEISRGVTYEDLTSAEVLQELDERAGFEDAQVTVTGHQIESRGFVYTVVPTVCTMDDPTDQLGLRDTGTAFCSNTDAAPSAANASDRNPDDYRRVSVTLTWKSGSAPTDTMTQTGIVTNPVGGLGPSITSLTPWVPNTTTIVTSNPASPITAPTYKITTSKPASEVEWSVSGQRMGSATGSDTSWSFTWNLGPVDAPNFKGDCTYVLQAVAIDSSGRAGAPKALTVKVDRRKPFAPTGFTGGLNLNNSGGSRRVDLQWNPNVECDIVSYKVFRSVNGGPFDTQICAVDADDPTECIDQNAPAAAAGALRYQVLAYDASSAGDASATLLVNEGNANAPTAPASLSICTGGNPGCNDIKGDPAPDGTAVLSWSPSTDPDGHTVAFYRIYRGGNTYANRFDVLFPQASMPLVFVDTTATTATSYYVSAVDQYFGESALTGPVNWGSP